MDIRPTIAEVQEWVMTLFNTCEQAITPEERKEQAKYAAMVRRPNDKRFLVKMLDESSQIRDNRKLAKRIKVLIDKYGIPSFLSPFDALQFKVYQMFGHHFDFVAIPVIKKRLRSDTKKVILDEARPALTEHLAKRFSQKVGQNVNLLGEVVLGNQEADHRYEHYLEALEAPDINYISVKISGIYAQTHALNYEESFPELVNRMSTLYRKAMDNPYVDPDGNKRYKFVNLDMEEYKDAHFTYRLFMEVLSKPEFKNYTAGIVVQAYLPDAAAFHQELADFAKKRMAEGGAPLKMRLVKGCNLEMETVVSSLRGWETPIRATKTETDANYLHVLEQALQPDNARALNIGVASHNLYSIAYAYLLAQRLGSADYMTFEMLEGMADHLWRAQSQLGNKVILYAPVVKDEHFLNAVSYLVRRMDETTAPENFLTHSFDLKPGSSTWEFLEKQFIDAYHHKDTLSHEPKRKQDRTKPYNRVEPQDTMFNEPDTDFDRECNQQWVRDIFSKWKKAPGSNFTTIPVQIGTETMLTEQRVEYFDRCQDNAVKIGEMCEAGLDEVNKILAIAESDPAGWRKTTLEERHRIMFEAANNLADMRGDIIGCMCAFTGKTVVEGDVEVSEAIDYARFYTLSMRKFEELADTNISPKGTILVISPWNFPCAIPVGGIVAALAGGNTVILKPANSSAPVATLFAEAFWKAGVPKETLQIVIAEDEALRRLSSADTVKHIILTGSTYTAQAIGRANPGKPLSAETGGKNAIILTASGDRDKAIMNIVQSAFGNAGQKCSACSLLLVEKTVYDDPSFREKLKDAATSLKVGSVWNPGNIVGPMITNKNEKLLKALNLEGGEEWLVDPRFLDKEKFLLAPCIKWGVRPGYYSFSTELFAPLLSVVRINNLEEGIKLVNSLDYGLTSGLQSLDENEQRLWKNSIQAGNLYINRGITGAIVNRQPFGGMKLSAFGGGVKAGGPNYCACFVNITDAPNSSVDYRKSYLQAWRKEFALPRDINNLHGEQNVFRYLPLTGMVCRIFEHDDIEQLRMIGLAAKTALTPLTFSIDTLDERAKALMDDGYKVVAEPLATFLDGMDGYERIRTASPHIPKEMYERAAAIDKYIATAPPVRQGRVELIHYIKEQSITFEYHRYGSIQEIPPVQD